MCQPRPDPDKPNCPYLPGFEVDISTHTAPPPFGGSGTYPCASYPFRTDDWLCSVTQTELVLTYPLLETPTPAQRDTARLTVQKAGAEAFEAVAKIYDPLYYAPFTDIGCYPSDTVCDADGDYSIESAAYEDLKKSDQVGLFTPAFFGSWTFCLPTSYKQKMHKRSVRLILIEHIPGICMKDLFVENGWDQIDATHLGKEYRLEVLAMILDGFVKLHHAGVNQGDLAPRNLIIVPPPDFRQERPERVVLIDYKNWKVWELSKYGKLPAQLAQLPPNPMKLFWNSSILDLSGWTPPEWWNNPRLCQDWLCREFGNERRTMYEPVVEELEFDEPVQETEATGREASTTLDEGVGHNYPKRGSRNTNEFEVVSAPKMADGERLAPVTGSLLGNVKAAWKSYEEGKLQD